ncbi:Glutaredoxin-3 [Geodia barretti]|uniref:Glutaredoxin-3 n=1 Tax=Geodia barretti TaxID=519541 RepID=A0AA35U1S1_GEOBA|nr:Glutaredoxin-3 [Geodia barretti]
MRVRRLVVVHFWAPWSQPCKQMNDVMVELAEEHPGVRFIRVEAEEFPEVSLKHEVVAVPTFIYLKGGRMVDRVNGAHVPELSKKTAVHSDLVAPPPPPADSTQTIPTEDVNARLKRLTTSSKCILFMKGNPQEPRCGFSRQVVALLDEAGADYTTFDILSDEEVRQGLKKFSNWPTYPQLYANGELVGVVGLWNRLVKSLGHQTVTLFAPQYRLTGGEGGSVVLGLQELKESGELQELLPRTRPLEERLKEVINQEHVVLFMKGSVESPQCGFSRSICEILKDNSVKFGTFDILSDEEVRQGLKKFSNWPTYPQLYVNGQLIGGLDIVKELEESGELQATLSSTDHSK